MAGTWASEATPAMTVGDGGRKLVIKVWGRNTSSNVQKVMWAIGEIGLAHERIDIGGAFGKNNEAEYLAKNPNGLVPTLEEEDGFLLWESNTIVRYLAAKHKAAVLEPADLRGRALASKWMDWQLSVCGPALTPVFWGLIRTPPEKRNHTAIEEGKKKSTVAFGMMDEQLGKTAYLAGDSFSYGDIPVAIMAYRYRQLVPDRPPLRNFERWYAAISSRPAFKDQVGSVPLS
ncbi:MAG TPA: glutathione S-transferase family protein [Xanthobacteraceae bacterium]|nr:glutathione S-transferase family protein [Xanthobacteraceae bacterium]